MPAKLVKVHYNYKIKIWRGFGESCILILTSISTILLESNMAKCSEPWMITSFVCKHVFETISWRNNSKEEKIRGKNRKTNT